MMFKFIIVTLQLNTNLLRNITMYAKIDQAIFAQGSELSARNTIWMLSDRNTRSTKVAY